jgi:UDP:flavonoid glycosyltransferase YjiC (YdhE family)
MGADLLLTDRLLGLGRLLGAVLGLPVVSHRWGVDPMGEIFEARLRHRLAPLCRRLVPPGLPDPALVVDPCPASLQHPDANPGHLMRYVPVNGAEVLPLWALARAARRRVCVCPGSTLLRFTVPRPVHRIAQALLGLKDTEVIFAMTRQDRARVGELPEDFRVAESVPLHLFLGTCDVFVCLGGGGSALTATLFGVPQLVLPQWFDHFHYSQRIAAIGAGLCIDSREGQDAVECIRTAIEKLLDDPGYRLAALGLVAENDAAPPPSAMVGLVESLVKPPKVPARPSSSPGLMP